MNNKNLKVYFIGAGPGDPELLTVKGKRIIMEADIIIYAGSLVNKAILESAKEEAVIYDSSKMSLDDVIDVIEKNKSSAKVIARVHSGDPSIYGAILEQMQWCDRSGIVYEVIPGVSSIFAASATLAQELTLPGISQTVIITRISGRTSVPPKEDLENISRIGATLVIYLSVDRIGDVVKKLLHGYEKETPVAVVYRASWPDEKIVKGTLQDIADKIKSEGINKQSLIIVGDVLNKKDFEMSKLYDKSFTHSCREGI